MVDNERWSRVLDIAQRYATQVDRESRLPFEALDSLRENELLGSGSRTSDLPYVLEACRALGRVCASTGLIYAMHHVQLGIIRRFGGPFHESALREQRRTQSLIASVTSEVVTGGDVSQSLCAFQHLDGRVHVAKNVPAISYAEIADYFLVSARRDEIAVASDQAMAVFRREDLDLQRTSTWEPTGMRGTCTHGFLVSGHADASSVFETPYLEIASTYEVSASHIHWAAVWLGICESALLKATDHLRAQSIAATDPRAGHAEDARSIVFTLQSTLASEARRLQREASVSGAIRANIFKARFSQEALTAVVCCMDSIGVKAYSATGVWSLDREIRDVLSARVMVSNARLRRNNLRAVASSIGIGGELDL